MTFLLWNSSIHYHGLEWLNVFFPCWSYNCCCSAAGFEPDPRDHQLTWRVWSKSQIKGIVSQARLGRHRTGFSRSEVNSSRTGSEFLYLVFMYVKRGYFIAKCILLDTFRIKINQEKVSVFLVWFILYLMFRSLWVVSDNLFVIVLDAAGQDAGCQWWWSFFRLDRFQKPEGILWEGGEVLLL